jgi:SpoVK/Ycf46/Vps4 family AAA+-type ATPase
LLAKLFSTSVRRRISRGKGLKVLFTGPSGNGKTMAAEVLASDLRLDLYRIDLNSVVSKYIGETGKESAARFRRGGRGWHDSAFR